MRAIFFSICAIILSITTVQGQDIIIKNDKAELKAKVIEIQEEYIKYYLFDQPNGPIRNIKILDVFMIIYADGTRETFQKEQLTKMKDRRLRNLRRSIRSLLMKALKKQ